MCWTVIVQFQGQRVKRVFDAAGYLADSGLLEDTDCLHLGSISRCWPAEFESRRLTYNSEKKARRLTYNSEKKVTFYSACKYPPTPQTHLNTNRPETGHTRLYDVREQHSIAQRSVRTAEAQRDSCQGMRKQHFTHRWYIWVVHLLAPPLREVVLPLRPTVTRASALQNSAFADTTFSWIS
jgi:hypothetical protein